MTHNYKNFANFFSEAFEGDIQASLGGDCKITTL
jgi:hypothetical protein